MKKPLKITLTVILILLIAASALAVWQRENIKALFIALKYSSPDEISILIDENDKIISDALKEYNTGEITELDEQQKKAADINGDGKITVDDARAIMREATGLEAE